MKKILGIFLVVLTAVVLVACKPKAKDDEVLTYLTYTSGTANINPYSVSLSTASDLYGYLTDSLYEGDYDWDAAIEAGLATHKGDFTNAASLPFNYLPAMAADMPVDVNGDGTVWRITLRNDLVFEDGTKIDANTFDYSWKQLLDPRQLNVRASNLYDATNLPILNAEAYVKQLSQKDDEFNEPMWDAGAKGVIKTANALAFVDEGDDIFHATLDGYFVYYYPSQKATFGGNWALLHAQDDVFGGWVTVDADGVPTVLPDGTANPDAGPAADYYQGAAPKLYYEDGTVVPLDAEGKPVGATAIPNDPVDWDAVGFEVISDYVFEITLNQQRDSWKVRQNLSSGITGVVHPARYEAGMNTARTSTTYGTIDNQLVSYGPYKLVEWQDDVLYLYEINDKHYAAGDYAIKKIRYDVITEQTIAVNEFKEGRLDVVGASGEFYKDFKDSPTLKLTPSTVFFRFAFNIETRPGKDAANPILSEQSFREAFYYAIDREEFVVSVRPPAYANQGFIGPVYVATEYGSTGYRGSQAGIDVFADRSPETAGYNPVLAKQLFDEAYANLVTAGKITDGDKVSIEYTYYKVETNDTVAEWVKSTVEAIFNGDGPKRFELVLNGISNEALDDAWDNFDFDMTFGGWQGVQFNPVSLMGQVYNSISGAQNMLEHGFNTGGAILTVDLPNTKAALTKWIGEYEVEFVDGDGTPTAAQEASYDRWVAALELFGKQEGLDTTPLKATEIRVSFDQLYKLSQQSFYNVKETNYDGMTEDFERMTAAIEEELLSQMIAIPLFTSVSATVYSSRVVFHATEYHAWMGWGGIKYMSLKK